jgi:tetratricopeptide (TPR) repeat protein
MSRRGRVYAVVLLLFVLAAAGLFVYGNTFRNEFVYDDSAFVVNNPNIRTLSPAVKFFDPGTSSNNPTMNGDLWRPLTTFSYALTYRFFGLSPSAFHVISVIMHIANAFLVFWLVFLIAARSAERTAVFREPLITAFIASLVFLVHPVQSESVAWISQRSNELFLFFLAPAFIAYIYHRSSPRGGDQLLLCVSLFAFVLSLLSKEMAISLPFIIFAYEYIIASNSIKGCLKQSIPYFAAVIAFALARQLALGKTAQTGYWAGGLIPQMLTMVKGFAYYVKLIFIPYPLSVDYLFRVKHTADLEVLGCGLLLAGIIYLGWRLRKDMLLISFGIFLFFLSLIPVSNVFPLRFIINERFLYLAAAGFGIALAQAAVDLAAARRKLMGLPSAVVVGCGLALLIAVYCSITVNRNLAWRDQYSFASENLKTCPQCATLHFAMGDAYASKREYDKAIEEYSLSLNIDPGNTGTLIDLGIIPPGENNSGSDIAQYRRSVQKRVELFNGLHALGVAYFNKGDYSKAVEILEKACSLRPDDLQAKANLANAYAYAGNLKKAIDLCLKILEKDPGMTGTRYDLAQFYIAAGQPEKAKEQYELAKKASMTR